MGSSTPASPATAGDHSPAQLTTIGVSIDSPCVVVTPLMRAPRWWMAVTPTPCSIFTPRRRAASANPSVTDVGSPYPESGSHSTAPSPAGSMRGSTRATSLGASTSARTPSARWRATEASSVVRIAGPTPMRAPQAT